MRGRNLMILVLDQMQVLDQEVAPARPVAKQKLDLVRGRRIDLTALLRRLRPPPALAGVIEGTHLMHIVAHLNVSSLTLVSNDSNSWHARCQENYHVEVSI